MQDSILNIEVSCFADYNTPDNPRPVNLLHWLTNKKYADRVMVIRNIADKEHRDRVKATLPAITPSGLFKRRAKKDLIRHSGFIQIDIDQKGNETVGNYSDLKKEICKITNIAYCGLSVSGKGFWGLIPIEQPDKHYQYFKLIEKWFKDKGLVIDKAPKSVSSLRGYAFDPDGYFNHTAKPLKRFYIEPVKNNKPLITNEKESDIFLHAQYFAMGETGSFRDGNRHNYIFHLCSYLCYRGISRHDAESWVYANLLPANEINSNCISYPYENYIAGEIKAIEQPEKKKQPIKEPDKTSHFASVNNAEIRVKQDRTFKENWDKELTELETFFEAVTLSAGPVTLNECMTVTDCPRFIQSHLATVKANNGNKTFLAYLDRLKTFKHLFENNKYLQP
jgi:VirE N-terminal domain